MTNTIRVPLIIQFVYGVLVDKSHTIVKLLRSNWDRGVKKETQEMQNSSIASMAGKQKLTGQRRKQTFVQNLQVHQSTSPPATRGVKKAKKTQLEN